MQGTDAGMARFKDISDVHRRIFAAMLSHLDDSVGKLLAKLDANGQTENTLIVFVSDNGVPTRELTSINLPLRGEKGQLLEGGIRIPFAITWPGITKPGTVIHTPAIATDLAATALAAAGLSRPTDADGKDLRNLLANPSVAPQHETLFWRVGKNAALRSGKWKLLRAGIHWELYDLEADPSESKDVAASNKELTKTLVERWETWSKTQVEPLWR